MAIKKIKIGSGTAIDIQDSRITGVDSTPTSGSGNVITSGGVYNALQNVTPSGVELTANKVTSLSSSSTDTQYPSAKAVYSLVGNIESVLNAIIMGA